jgi:hypothetical protein
MQKVINIFLVKREDFKKYGLSDSSTGLLLELEDGTFQQGLSTDVLTPFAELVIPKE